MRVSFSLILYFWIWVVSLSSHSILYTSDSVHWPWLWFLETIRASSNVLHCILQCFVQYSWRQECWCVSQNTRLNLGTFFLPQCKANIDFLANITFETCTPARCWSNHSGLSHTVSYTPCVNVFIITIVCLQPTLEIITRKILQMIPRNTFFFPSGPHKKN